MSSLADLFRKPRPRRAPIKWTAERAIRRLMALSRASRRFGFGIGRLAYHMNRIPYDDEIMREVNRRQGLAWRARVFAA